MHSLVIDALLWLTSYTKFFKLQYNAPHIKSNIISFMAAKNPPAIRIASFIVLFLLFHGPNTSVNIFAQGVHKIEIVYPVSLTFISVIMAY